MARTRNTDTSRPPLWKRALHGFATLSGTAMVIAMAAGAVWVGSATLATRAAAVDAPAPAPATSVVGLRIAPSDHLTVTRQFHGQIEASQTVSLGFEQSGRLNVLSVDEGDRVRAGQVIARLDTRILMAERARLEASRAALEAQAELSRRTTARQSELRDRGFASDQAVDNVALGLQGITAQMAEIDAAITQVDVRLAQSDLLAPFDGTIGARHVDPGTIVGVGSPVLEVRQDATPVFRVGIDPKLARDLPEAHATITLDGVEHDASFIGFRPDLDAQTRTRTALFNVTTNDPVYLASGTLSVQTRLDQPGYAIPLRALRDGVRGLWAVLVLEPEGDGMAIARAAAVEVLQIEGDTVYVRGTFSGEVMIVPDGTHRVVSGDRVTLIGG